MTVVERHDDDRARTLTLCGHETRNALSADVVELLGQELEAAARDGVRILVLCSATTTFSSGFDLSDLGSESDRTIAARFRALQLVLDLLTSSPFVTIALVDGPAVGAGADLALACDMRMMTPNARIRLPGARFGLVLGVERLADLLPPDRLLDALTGRWIPHPELVEWRLATHSSPTADDAQLAAEELLSRLHGTDRHALDAAVALLRRRSRPGVEVHEQTRTVGLLARLSEYAGSRNPVVGG